MATTTRLGWVITIQCYPTRGGRHQDSAGSQGQRYALLVRPGLQLLGGRLEPDELARKIVEAAADKQAEDVLLLDIRKVVSFADYFVIASGSTVRQIQAIIESVEEAVSADGVKPIGLEGKPDSGWVLLDYGDVILHVFAPQEREYYDLEGLWHGATPVVRIQ